MGKYDSMTVNERLFVAGLMDAFDNAKASGDRKAMQRVLLEVGLLATGDVKGVNRIIDTYLRDN